MRALLVLLAACTADKEPVETGDPLSGPTLSHTPPTGTWIEGDTVSLEVLAEDPDGVSLVQLYWRTEGERNYEVAALTALEGGLWAGEVEGLEEPGLEYYFSASDATDTPITVTLPEQGEEEPFALPVLVDALDVPFFEDFEPEDGEEALYQLDWWTPSAAFPGSPWALGEGESGNGAVHLRGVSEDQTIQDWLISPPLDLSTLDSAMVRWRERGAAVQNASHGLYVSTTGRDLEEDVFVPVNEALPAPVEGEWADASAVDLSAWAGEPVVYVAWLYEGAVADDWSIDDVEVRALAPDLAAELSWSPDPAAPGDAVTLTVTLTNLVDAGTTDLVGTLSLPEGGGTLDEDSASFGDLDGLGTAEGTFELTLDSDLDENQRVPLALELTDGLDTWSFDLDLQVGEPSTGTLVLTLDEAGSVVVSLGVGDPDEPTLETSLYSGSLPAGESTLSADLTDYFAYLPPAAGPDRWFARVLSSATGDVDDVTLSVGGEDYSATELPALTADEESLVYVPEPPDPTLLTTTTEPSSLAPGDSGATLTLELSNNGSDTFGAVTGTLSSLDEDVVVYGGEELSITTGVWRTGVIVTLEGLSLDVAADHDDSTPVTLLLTVDDGLERWELPVELEVPWPVLQTLSVEIDDEGGDGRLDAGEEAELTITLANSGDLRTFGPLDAALSVADGSAVGATLGVTEDSLSSIDAASTRETDGYTLVAGDGETGEVLTLLLSLEDGTASYAVPVEIPLGEVPWARVGATNDDAGDNVDDYAFDYTSIRWREEDGVLSFWLSSDVAYDPDTLFIEAWGISTGADYTYYRIVYQSGVGKLQGYDSGFVTIGDVDATLVSERDLVLSMDVADLGLLLDELSIGFAAGWCGPDEYYCDHYPDGWGYPYVSFTSTDWFDLSW